MVIKLNCKNAWINPTAFNCILSLIFVISTRDNSLQSIDTNIGCVNQVPTLGNLVRELGNDLSDHYLQRLISSIHSRIDLMSRSFLKIKILRIAARLLAEMLNLVSWPQRPASAAIRIAVSSSIPSNVRFIFAPWRYGSSLIAISVRRVLQYVMIVTIRLALMLVLNTSTWWNGAGLIELLMIYVFYTANLFIREHAVPSTSLEEIVVFLRITACVLQILL